MATEVEGKSTAQAAVKGHEGKYLTFVLGAEEYGLEILKVREIIGLMEITIVPQTPEFIKGVINLRGKVIPVIDLRLKFGMAEAEPTDETCIIVVDIKDTLMGILVDTVSEVLDIAVGEIEAAPAFGGDISTEYILGMGKIKGNVKILLDIDMVLSQEEMTRLAQVDGEAY